MADMKLQSDMDDRDDEIPYYEVNIKLFIRTSYSNHHSMAYISVLFVIFYSEKKKHFICSQMNYYRLLFFFFAVPFNIYQQIAFCIMV